MIDIDVSNSLEENMEEREKGIDDYDIGFAVLLQATYRQYQSGDPGSSFRLLANDSEW